MKPALEEEYELEKEKKKFFLAMEALAEDARVMDAQYLTNALTEAQSHVRSPEIIALYHSWGLWDFDFIELASPEKYAEEAYTFRKRFFEVEFGLDSSKSTWATET